jgi:outer membrane protein assembly factor BamB
LVFLPTTDGKVLAVDVGTGNSLGRVKVLGGGSGSAVLADGILYVAGTRTVTALVAGSATPIANRATPPVATVPATSG